MTVNKLLIISVLLVLKLDSISTGPSFCVVKIIPVATGDRGTVLFKTYFRMNSDGAGFLVPVELGWLVVSASGTWEMLGHAHLDFENGNRASVADSLYLKEFEAPFNWQNPPQSVRPALEKYHLYTRVRSNRAANSIYWKPDGIYRKNQRVKSINIIKSLNSITNEPGKGSPVRAFFYHQGVALFRSQLEFDDESSSLKGAAFFQGESRYQDRELWLDSYMIDGLVVLSEKN